MKCLIAAVAVMAIGGVQPMVNAEGIVPELAPYTGESRNDIDVTSVKGKVMCGYQMWFGTPGDGVSDKWVHWSGRDTVSGDNLTVEMWPDLTDYPKAERFAVPGMKHEDGTQACLFSSKRPAVADLHFKWMRDYGIDGVFVQRFLCGCHQPNSLATTCTVAYARNSANKYGRAFALSYDLSGTPSDKIFDMLVKDWKFLVDEMKLTSDKRYLHQDGKPVLEIFGFYPERFSGDLANRIIDFFKHDTKYGAYLVGSGAWWWRTVEDQEWAKAFRRFDAIKPWNVGNTMAAEDGRQMACTTYWAEDMKEARKAGMLYMPVVYPGFSWDNLMRVYKKPENVGHPISRRGGEFFWEQFVTATEMKVGAIYVAMFDEVDEGTAIFKVTNDPPVDAHFVTFEGKPSDCYLRLTGRGTRMFQGRIPVQKQMPGKF